jgi:hypothetical protein
VQGVESSIVIEKKEYARRYIGLSACGVEVRFIFGCLSFLKRDCPILSAKRWYFSSGQVRSLLHGFLCLGYKTLGFNGGQSTTVLALPFIRSVIDVDVIPILLSRKVLSTRYTGG